MSAIATTAMMLGLVATAAPACDSDEDTREFSINFNLVDGDNGTVNGCTTLTGLGDGGAYSAALKDVRFYVSNLIVKDADGNELEYLPAQNDFQYQTETDQVTLIDFSTNSGDCASDLVAEGTERTNTEFIGRLTKGDIGDIAQVEFEAGVSQTLMQDVIANHTTEGAPSPLAEMYWSWASGYRHMVVNFVSDLNTNGASAVHVGSTGCVGDALALDNKDQCDFVNTPRIHLSNFDVSSDKVGLDIRQLFSGVSFATENSVEFDGVTYELNGVQCHSGASQTDCDPVFESLGIDRSTGQADAAANAVFIKN